MALECMFGTDMTSWHDNWNEVGNELQGLLWGRLMFGSHRDTVINEPRKVVHKRAWAGGGGSLAKDKLTLARGSYSSLHLRKHYKGKNKNYYLCCSTASIFLHHCSCLPLLHSLKPFPQYWIQPAAPAARAVNSMVISINNIHFFLFKTSFTSHQKRPQKYQAVKSWTHTALPSYIFNRPSPPFWVWRK